MERRTRRAVLPAVAIAGTALLVAALLVFEPWKLWVNETVQEPLPTAVPTSTAGPGPAAAPVAVAQGTFVSHEHSTTGTAKVIRLPDGSHTLRLEGLNTSNGPDLHVWLSDAPVKKGRSGWTVFDDGKHVDVAELKGNRGDQNYPLPANLDWPAYPSVSIWCARFHVSFGAAPLTRT
ncbi:electron transfer DM13 [Actinocorallia herbida]|uniref:Electron transfer DM13 n=1 Tax=Actinocorallia herbida TaxID=58109 RepID=A0A3N1CZG4_9ACTN|nr:DM13 domain-containing protein [Actinocorallia herbida]ROO86683.1 electron transfer DM13 [Actinocorallia herbida]